jgi:glycosyltransferase involved in cell wall biosynthesis
MFSLRNLMSKKILQICFGDGYAGSAKMAILFSNLVNGKEFEVTFLASLGSLTEKRAREKNFNVISMDSRQNFKSLIEEIYSVFDKIKPDYVISHHSLDRKIGISLRKKFGKRFINIGYRHNITKSAPIIGALLYNYYFDYLIACGDGVGKSLISSGIKRKKVKVIHYGIEVPENIDQITGSVIRDKFGLNGKTVIGCSAWFHKQRKGFDILFKAFATLDERFLLFIIGIHEDMKAEVLKYGEEFGINPSRIIMPGYVDNIEEYYKAMDIFVFPSRSEGFPLAPLEAGACRLPIVASNIPGTNEFIESGVNGILYPVEDYEALADGIVKIGSDPKLSKEFSEKAYQTVMTKYTSLVYKENLAAFLKEITV